MTERRPVELLTLGDVLTRAARQWPDAVAVAFPDHRVSFAELLEQAYRAARGLHALGVRRGDRFGIFAPNCLDYVAVLFGGALLGAQVVTVNARYRSAELAYVMRDAELTAIVTSDVLGEEVDFVGLIREAGAGARSLRACVVLGGTSADGFVDRARFDKLAEDVPAAIVDGAADAVRIRDVAIMMYTSGTTAQPKGCPLTHEAIVRTSHAINERFDLTEADVWWDPLPMFHLSSILPLMAALLVGSRFATMVDFDADTALRQIVRERVTFHFGTFPTLNGELFAHPDFADADLGSMRYINQAGPPDLQRALQAAFPHAVQIGPYGCTELGGIISMTYPDDPPEVRATTNGHPFPGMEVRIVDPETREPLPAGEPGEIAGRGWGMFEGYHNAPERNAEALDADGWFYTGDMGVLDADGRVAFLGRTKDMLKVGGENVAALEVESFLATHPAVRLAQVVGLPDTHLVEIPAAFVQLETGREATPDELVAFCRGRIASFKIPRHIRFVDDWPMSATKIQKFKLREELIAELGLE
jgi:acyl-CoA synthetase (AMP-forming)/AMP-acid ligase II